jgi:CheY-like chemotaxis protein
MAQHADKRPLSVLVVDDNRDAAHSLSLFLRLHGHDTRVADSGEQAAAIASEWHPDAAVLEVVMNGGVELAARLRRGATRPTMIVGLTGAGTADELARANTGAFDRVLLKPVDPDELLRVLSSDERADIRIAHAAEWQEDQERVLLEEFRTATGKAAKSLHEAEQWLMELPLEDRDRVGRRMNDSTDGNSGI